MHNALVTQSAPYSQEGEEATLGSILVNPECFPAVMNILKTHGVFFFVRHGYILQAMSHLNERGVPIDYLLLCQELKDMGWLEEIGGPAYLTYLVNATPTSIYGEFYAGLVRDTWKRRRAMIMADEIKGLALKEDITFEQAWQQVSDKYADLDSEVQTQVSKSLGTLIHEQMDRIETAFLEGKIVGVPTGLDDLDKLLGGWRKTRVYGVLARTHMGKTSFMLGAALHAGKQGQRVLYISLEENFDDLTDRLLSLETGIAKDKLTTGDLTPKEYGLYVEACGRLAQLPVELEYLPMLTPRTLLDKITAHQRNNGLDLVMVDYIQRMSAGPLDKNGDYERLSHISLKMPMVAQKRNIPLVYGIQAGRQVEKREDKRPLMEDSEGCGKIEQTLDGLITLYRDSYYNSATEFPNQYEVTVLKNKISMKAGTISAYGEKITGRIVNGQKHTIDLGDDYTPPPSRKTIRYPKAAGGTHASFTAEQKE